MSEDVIREDTVDADAGGDVTIETEEVVKPAEE